MLARTHACSEAKLKAVKVDKANVETIASEFSLPLAVAERQLRLNGGSLNATIAALVAQ